MEPADDRREHGSEDPGRLTCADRSLRKGLVYARCWGLLDGLVKVQEVPLTCVRALPSFRVIVSALAAQLDGRKKRGQFLMESPAPAAVDHRHAVLEARPFGEH